MKYHAVKKGTHWFVVGVDSGGYQQVIEKTKSPVKARALAKALNNAFGK